MLLVVAYDIADDRRRAKLHTLLLGYGVPVQESLFECELDEHDLRRLKQRVGRLVRPRRDRVSYYALCAGCAARVEDLAGPRPAAPPAYVV